MFDVCLYTILLCGAASSWRGARSVSGASPTGGGGLRRVVRQKMIQFLCGDNSIVNARGPRTGAGPPYRRGAPVQARARSLCYICYAGTATT